MPHPLYTIGHSNHAFEHFVALLQEHGVELVADVRSVPASARHPQFSRKALEPALAARGIRYLFLGQELGARRTEREAYEDGVATYERIARLPAFRAGLERVKEISASSRIALMCAEKAPLDCHRALLVCRHRTSMASRRKVILSPISCCSRSQSSTCMRNCDTYTNSPTELGRWCGSSCSGASFPLPLSRAMLTWCL